VKQSYDLVSGSTKINQAL